MRKWFTAQRVLDIISNEDWIWTRNVNCKYITLRIDTRDGKCVILDRNGAEIALSDVERQYGVTREPNERGVE